MADKLVMESLNRYIIESTDNTKKEIIAEALKLIDGPGGDIVPTLMKILPYDRQTILGAMREAAEYKDERVRIENISEGI